MDALYFAKHIQLRMFARDHVADILNKRAKLRESDYILQEDSTLIARRLLYAVKHHPLTESAWMIRGIVWAKTLKGGRDSPKIKISMHDNLETVLS